MRVRRRGKFVVALVEERRFEGAAHHQAPALLQNLHGPGLNPIEPKWMHGKRAVAEPDGLITLEELERRVCVHFDCELEPPLRVAEKAA
jgi:hypothetical protein